jgi:quercetin dioxygenase-like cupin family protein
MPNETSEQRSARILGQLSAAYPGKNCYDMSGTAEHFVCETEPVSEHAGYDKAIEVIISSKPHKHLKMTQSYTILKGNLELHVDDEVINLKPGDNYTIEPHKVHWATSEDECWVEIYSKPGWTKEDHIVISK